MDLKQITYILEIAKSESMTQAAKNLHISQPALSQSYRNLEKELGVTFFKKKGRGLELTEDGQFFCEKGAEILKNVDAFEKMLRNRHQKDGKVIYYYTDVVDNADESMLLFQKFYPDVHFERCYGSEQDAVRYLRSGQIDCALTLRKIDEPDIVSEKLIDEPVVILVSEQSPLAGLGEINLAQLDGEILTMYQNAGSLRRLFEEFLSDAGASASRDLELYDPVMQVEQGVGFIFMPESTYYGLKEQNSLRHSKGILVKDSFCRRRVFLSCWKDYEPDKVCQGFFDFLWLYHEISLREAKRPLLNRFQPGKCKYTLKAAEKGK